MKKKTIGICVGVLLMLLLGVWLFTLPIACGKGWCITKADVNQYKEYDKTFSTAAGSAASSYETILTSRIRNSLLLHAPSLPSITQEDAARYRTEILRLTEEKDVERIGFSSLSAYDTAVIIPFLTQEALMKKFKVSDPALLYAQLAQNQSVVLLLKGYTWNTESAQVIPQ
jgi:hypothetical protein